MGTMWAALILIPGLFLGIDEKIVLAERKASEPPTKTKALVIEGTNGIRVRMEIPDAGLKTLTIRGIARGRVRMEWDDKLALESSSFVTRAPDDGREGKNPVTTVESSGEGSVKLTTDCTTIECASMSLHFVPMLATVPR